MANGRRDLPPGVPQAGDMGMPNANETTGNPGGGPTGPFTGGSDERLGHGYQGHEDQGHGDQGPAQDPPMTDAERHAQALRDTVQRDLHRNPDERFRYDAIEHRRDDDGREEDLNMVRGGDRAYNHDDWERSMGPTDPERRRQIRRMFEDSVLPQLPRRPGWRRCWVSTTHNYDTPQFRRGLGYFFVSYENLQHEGWAADQYAVKDARNIYSGCVMWREMIAMETDEKNWYTIMRELHHDMPYELSRGIYDMIDGAGQQIRDMGGRTSMAPGMETLRQYTRPPRQFH